MTGKLTVAKRLALGFGLIVSLMVLISVVGNHQVGFIDRTLTSVNEGASLKQRYAINFRGSVHDRAIAIRDVVLVDSDSAMREQLRTIEELADMYQDNAANMTQVIRNQGATDRERQLADGQLDQSLKTGYPDSVMGALVDTIGQLTGIISEVRSAAEELSSASNQLEKTSDNNSQQIRMQAAEAEQMAATVNEVAGYAANAATATRKADAEVETGNLVVQQTASSITELANKLEDAAASVNRVSEDSGNIEKIIEVISGIAEQTNLLALNAAIEAARAGAHGRGFAVVADEVRSLASRTQDSTREIQDMIGRLQAGAGEAASEMQHSRDLAVLAGQLRSRVSVFQFRN